MKSKSLLSLLLALVLVISFAVPVSAADDYDTKAQDRIIEELAKNGLNQNDVSEVVRSMTTNQLEVIEFNQDYLSERAAQLRADINKVLKSNMTYSEKGSKINALIVEAYEDVYEIFEEAGIEVDLSSLVVVVQGSTFYVKNIKISNPSKGVDAYVDVPIGGSANANTDTDTDKSTPTPAPSPAVSDNDSTSFVPIPSNYDSNPLGKKTGDGSFASALICLVVLGGALVVGTRKSASVSRSN